MLDVKKLRKDFPILQTEVYGKPLIYLDSGATAQKPSCVIDRIAWMYRNINANIHRGVHYLSEKCTEEYEAVRETVREFINAGSTAEIIFTSGATAGINLVAHSFGERYIGAGDNVVVSEMEHHSNIVPWQLICERKDAKIRVLPFDDEGRIMVEKLPGLIDERTRMVAVSQASNVLGTRPDLQKIIEIAHKAGVPVLVDGCQGIVHEPTDVTALDCDFYAFSGHKLYGPTGIGVLYGKRRWLEEMPPFMGGGDMVGTVEFRKTTYAELPLKFEAGTAHFIGASGLGEAIKYLRQYKLADIMAHENHLTELATRKLSDIDGLRIYGTQPDKCSIVSFMVEGAHPYDMGMILDKMGIAIRTGTHCAEPVMTHYGVTGMCRASLAMYNTTEEIETLAAGVRRAAGMLRR